MSFAKQMRKNAKKQQSQNIKVHHTIRQSNTCANVRYFAIAQNVDKRVCAFKISLASTMSYDTIAEMLLSEVANHYKDISASITDIRIIEVSKEFYDDFEYAITERIYF